MKIGLFIPCYVDQFYPQVGIATLKLLQQLGCDVDYPLQQTCCGQPLANSGMEQEAIPIYKHFVKTFEPYDFVVTPSGSCAYHVRHHFDVLESKSEVMDKTLELSEFLINILELKELDVSYPHKVGLHQSCHGLRGLRLGGSSERVEEHFSNYHYLLSLVKDIELVPLSRMDECCGFGGTFAVNEPAISVKMGKDRIEDHMSHGATVVTAGDMSCLMHLEGIARRQKQAVRFVHIAEILSGIATPL